MPEKEKTTIARETVDKYINEYYKVKYLIDETVQPKFWEAIALLCGDAKADITKYISDVKKYCVRYTNLTRKSVTIYSVRSVTELAKKIAREIRNSELKEINKFEYFLLKNKVKDMEETLTTIENRLGIYN